MKAIVAAGCSLGLPGAAAGLIPQEQGRQAAPGSAHPQRMGGWPNPRRPGRKNLLAWADVRNGFQHDCITHALSTIENLGYASKLYDTFIRTDSQPITKHGLYGSDGQKVYGKDLNDYDAIFFFGVREIDLTAEQRSDLLSFVHDDGKGFVVAHSGSTAFMSWPEFGELLGGRFDNHPWGVVEAPVVVDNPKFPATSFLPPVFQLRDEMYQTKDLSRKDVDVLLRLDTSKMKTNLPTVHIKNGDFPLAWAKTYGQGRVFYCALSHIITNWDIPDIQRIFFEGVKWALRLTDADVTPHPLRSETVSPVALPGPLPPCGPSWALHR